MPIGWTEDGKKTIKEVKANMLTSVSEDGEILQKNRNKILNTRALIKNISLDLLK